MALFFVRKGQKLGAGHVAAREGDICEGRREGRRRLECNASSPSLLQQSAQLWLSRLRKFERMRE